MEVEVRGDAVVSGLPVLTPVVDSLLGLSLLMLAIAGYLLW